MTPLRISLRRITGAAALALLHSAAACNYLGVPEGRAQLEANGDRGVLLFAGHDSGYRFTTDVHELGPVPVGMRRDVIVSRYPGGMMRCSDTPTATPGSSVGLRDAKPSLGGPDCGQRPPPVPLELVEAHCAPGPCTIVRSAESTSELVLSVRSDRPSDSRLHVTARAASGEVHEDSVPLAFERLGAITPTNPALRSGLALARGLMMNTTVDVRTTSGAIARFDGSVVARVEGDAGLARIESDRSSGSEHIELWTMDEGAVAIVWALIEHGQSAPFVEHRQELAIVRPSTVPSSLAIVPLDSTGKPLPLDRGTLRLVRDPEPGSAPEAEAILVGTFEGGERVVLAPEVRHDRDESDVLSVSGLGESYLRIHAQKAGLGWARAWYGAEMGELAVRVVEAR